MGMSYVPPSASSIVTSSVLPLIHSVIAAVAVVGASVLLLMVFIMVWKWLRKVLFGTDKKEKSTVAGSSVGARSMGVQVDLSKFK